jgi:phage baseplate assembly protein W
MSLRFPYQIDGRGRTAGTAPASHLRELIEQVLFTAPGERVNRPDFGSGLRQLVFAPASEALATTVQVLVQGALQHWLGDLLQVEGVEVRAEEATVHVTVRYMALKTRERQVAEFSRKV